MEILRFKHTLLYDNKYCRRYLTDTPWRTQISLGASLLINLLYAVFQFIIGIYHASFWYGAVAIYYMVICSVRFWLLRHFRKTDETPQRELRAFRFCGLLLFAVTIAMSGMIIQMVRDGQGARYPGYMIYAMATYAFYRITISIINIVRQRGLQQPLLAASKALNLATALMAIFSLQTALIAAFGDAGTFETIMNTTVGSAICLAILCMAIWMVLQANKRLKMLQLSSI